MLPSSHYIMWFHCVKHPFLVAAALVGRGVLLPLLMFLTL